MNQFKVAALAIAMAGVVGCGGTDDSSTPKNPPVVVSFEADTSAWTGAQSTRVASSAQLAASAGGYYAAVQGVPDGYGVGYADGGYSYFGGKGTTYVGDFYQSIDVYIDAQWAAPTNPAVPAFWIDMSPNRVDPNNYGAEHNFELYATGSAVGVGADNQTPPFVNITASGWYTFLMTFEKGATADTPVVTKMVVLNAQKQVLGQAIVAGTSVGGPLPSKDLLGNGYVWITVWQDGFAGDTLAIDNLKTGLLPY
jgi:hypothetical protein